MGERSKSNEWQVRKFLRWGSGFVAAAQSRDEAVAIADSHKGERGYFDVHEEIKVVTFSISSREEDDEL